VRGAQSQEGRRPGCPGVCGGEEGVEGVGAPGGGGTARPAAAKAASVAVLRAGVAVVVVVVVVAVSGCRGPLVGSLNPGPEGGLPIATAAVGSPVAVAVVEGAVDPSLGGGR
jgi:hypothetical protein